MRTVVDDEGDTYLLLKQGTDSWLVRDPSTGDEEYRAASTLTVTGDSPLVTAATAVPDTVRSVTTSVGTDHALGLLVMIADHGPTPARTLIDVVERCESDLQGLLADLQAAELITETEVGGQPGYELTSTGAAGIDALREPPD